MRPRKTVYEITIKKMESDQSLVITLEGPNAAAGVVKDWIEGHLDSGGLGPHNSTVEVKAIEVDA